MRDGEAEGKTGGPNPGGRRVILVEETYRAEKTISLSREQLKGKIKCRDAYKEK